MKCPECGYEFPSKYKSRPVCECGAKRWERWSGPDGITLRCKNCGHEEKVEAEKR